MRRMQRFAKIEQPPFHRLRCWRVEERFEQRRSVDNDYGPSRSARTASAGAMESITARRRSSRARNSSGVGLPAGRRISLSK
jgi:hypothetical protein